MCAEQARVDWWTSGFLCWESKHRNLVTFWIADVGLSMSDSILGLTRLNRCEPQVPCPWVSPLAFSSNPLFLYTQIFQVHMSMIKWSCVMLHHNACVPNLAFGSFCFITVYVVELLYLFGSCLISLQNKNQGIAFQWDKDEDVSCHRWQWLMASFDLAVGLCGFILDLKPAPSHRCSMRHQSQNQCLSSALQNSVSLVTQGREVYFTKGEWSDCVWQTLKDLLELFIKSKGKQDSIFQDFIAPQHFRISSSLWQLHTY